MHPGADDRRLAKRLHRDARSAARLQQRAEQAYLRAVARRERRIEKARGRLPVQAVVAVGSGLASFPLGAPWEWMTGAVFFVYGLGAIRSFSTLHSAPPIPLRALTPGTALPAPAVPMPPPPSSATWPAIRRLEAVREELRRLLPLVAPAGREAAEEAWHAASEADNALRWQAARIAAVEPHRGVELELMRALEDGVVCQERLVRAVADLVAASADPLASARLQDVTDRLLGLAEGLREVR